MMEITINCRKFCTKLLWIFLFTPLIISAQDNSPASLTSDNKHQKTHNNHRAHILKDMEKAMGKLPVRGAIKPSDIHIVDSLKETAFIRYNILFTIAENETIPVYLYIPVQRGAPKRLPAMLVLHETDPLGRKAVDGQAGKPNRAHARELAERGYIVIAPDFPSFGDQKDYDFDTDRYQSGTMKGIFNHMRCIDLLQSRADVDAENIGVIGHSLGGHNSIFVAAFDNRIKVAVSSCGWTQFEYYSIGEAAEKKYGGRLGPWAQTRYMPLLQTKYKLDGDRIPFNFDKAISAIAPRAFFSVSPLRDANFDYKGVEAGIAKVKPVYDSLGVPDMLQVRYPNAEHDFPVESRKEAYAFIDKILGHKPVSTDIK
ncbi:Prolyl oligopeptidase family protein [Daejeonella rubra]|uniref:Prolyl oligopeptidase family protein n=1 Tax=Daejeonella rubra TaxID=990371 RepID=A0A1G9S4R9_9SPHI|nr:alpha/beta fold hydrolase [Daejeonella rubra]SDM30392.1 Prolyl oligopeptidase family protein [Daejeonella rubra]